MSILSFWLGHRVAAPVLSAVRPCRTHCSPQSPTSAGSHNPPGGLPPDAVRILPVLPPGVLLHVHDIFVSRGPDLAGL